MDSEPGSRNVSVSNVQISSATQKWVIGPKGDVFERERGLREVEAMKDGR